MIQFPQGSDPTLPAVPGTERTPLQPGRTTDLRASTSSTPIDGVTLQSGVVAALDLEMLRGWEDGPARAAGATEYQLARHAVQSGDHIAALDHLGQAIRTHPSYAVMAAQDAEFTEIKEPVRDLVGRLTLVARIHAEAAITEAGEGVHALHATASMHAQAYLDMAQAQFQTASYAGYVQAAQAAAFAQQIAAQSKVTACAQPAALTYSGEAIRLRHISRAAGRATRLLWQRLPLLAILLGWLLAGIAGGLVSMPFQRGGASELRQLLFSIWALGLLGMVVLGFLRSIRNIRIGRLK